MLKRLLKLIRILFVGAFWTYLYLLMANILLITFWNFNTLSPNSWQLLKIFWQSGGVIRSGRDYTLLLCLLMLVPLWFIGFISLLRVKYINLLLAPVRIYNNRIISKYGADSKRIILRNLGRSKKIAEMIEIKSQSKTQIKTDEEVSKIRSAILEKINSAQKAKK